MKKLGFLTFFALLFFGVTLGFSPTAHASEGTIQEALELIEQTNIEIDEIIDAGVEEADALWADYLAEKAELKDALEVLLQETARIKTAIVNAGDAVEHAELSAQLIDVQAEIALLEENIAQRTAKFDQEVDAIITYVFDVTFEMSANTIARVAEMGVIAECSWKYVRFADRWAWIDPVRVVGT
ncbi:hypothetical protein [Sutcliffiella rhizosphaerae]|uniref:Uncharacterized protein n=1 Tax=Sutcliffiella rhizosphaerae TaxID=2880967 RepID=A0ABN8ABD7_9BACI|nr:hypothetical protein [Sutcliffiella rhizosphaerae]CAG9622515.1 hypothetical protein BACCIP111883_03306 [Sutcliffiella rhizosphaerae]